MDIFCFFFKLQRALSYKYLYKAPRRDRQKEKKDTCQIELQSNAKLEEINPIISTLKQHVSWCYSFSPIIEAAEVDRRP